MSPLWLVSPFDSVHHKVGDAMVALIHLASTHDPTPGRNGAGSNHDSVCPTQADEPLSLPCLRSKRDSTEYGYCGPGTLELAL